MNNQNLYLKYLESYFNKVKLNKYSLKLKKIKISIVPELLLLKEHAEDVLLNQQSRFKPYLQIFIDNKIIYNSIDFELNEN